MNAFIAPKIQISNQRGSLTLDFIFASLLAFTFCGVFFAITMTLGMAFVSQYIAYSTSRAYIGAHATPDLQTAEGMMKFEELTNNRVLAPLLRNGWFELKDPKVGSFNDAFASDSSISKDSAIFQGAVLLFEAKVLEMRLPFFGNTFEEEGRFQALINSFLTREPSEQECMSFNRARFEAIVNLNSGMGYGNYQHSNVAAGEYAVMADNGC